MYPMRIAALLNVGDLRGGVVRRAVKHGDRNHRRKIVGEAAGEEKIEAAVLVAARGIHVAGRVPGINRRGAISGRFVADTLLDLGKGAAGIDGADANFLDRVSHAVADVVRSMQIAGVRRFRHQDAHVLRGDGRVGELQIDGSALRIFHCARGESLPLALRALIEVERAFSHPIFHLIGRGVRARPGDANRIHRLFGLQIHDHPLRVQRVAFTRELAGEIGIALPIAEIRALQRAVAAGREAAVRQRIGQNVAQSVP